jgi:hypothetical protein
LVAEEKGEEPVTFEQAIGMYNWWSFVAGVAVALGLLGEYLLVHSRKEREHPALALSFASLVFFGVLAEPILNWNVEELMATDRALSQAEIQFLTNSVQLTEFHESLLDKKQISQPSPISSRPWN